MTYPPGSIYRPPDGSVFNPELRPTRRARRFLWGIWTTILDALAVLAVVEYTVLLHILNWRK